MKKISIKSLFIAIFGMLLFTNISNGQKLITKVGHAKFFSHTPIEDIQAHNYKVTSTLDQTTGAMVFSVPMQSFEFEKSLMQKHFNKKKFLSTKKYPKAKFKGKITDLSVVDFSQDGDYKVNVEGDLTIRGKTNHVNETGTITVKDGKVSSNSTFNIVLGEYGISFKKGKPSRNIGKSVEITVELDY